MFVDGDTGSVLHFARTCGAWAVCALRMVHKGPVRRVFADVLQQSINSQLIQSLLGLGRRSVPLPMGKLRKYGVTGAPVDGET